MKRPVEKPLEFALMTVTFDPLGINVVVLEVPMDWGLTGEVHLKYTTLRSLKDFNHVLQHAQNFVADEIVEKDKQERLELKRKNAPPF